jgi:hypothetical protein
MILSIAWLSNSLAVMPLDSATAMSLASFCGSSGKVIVILSFFFLGDTVHNVPQKLSISQSTRRQATRSKECHGTGSGQTTGDGRALISARVAQQDSTPATDSCDQC